MTDLHDLLDGRARAIEPLPDAFAQVIRKVHRRHRRRKAMVGGTALLVLAGALVSIAVVEPTGRREHGAVIWGQLLGTRQTLAVRQELGIEGPTKGAPDSVMVVERTGSGRVDLALVHVRTGKSTNVQLQADTNEASVSSKGDVAAVSHHKVIVTSRKEPSRTAAIPETDGADGQVSWDATGSLLFTRIKGQWVRVSNPAGTSQAETGHPLIQHVTVPTIPGGPILISVSPAGGVAALFGITYPEGEAPVPHLFVGHFTGVVVSDPREIDIPPGALAGPMGWVGDNAFLLAPGPGKALVVRTDGSRIEVTAEGIDDPCRSLQSALSCSLGGPKLLGTNADGSLLFWKISAERAPAQTAPILVLYYKTWLDGTHGVRLTGLIGQVGPPVAPR